MKGKREAFSWLSSKDGHLHSVFSRYVYRCRYRKFDQGATPCFSTSPSNPDNKVPLNLAYHRANIRQLRSVPISSSSVSLRPLIRLLDAVKGYCGTVKMSCTELVYAIHCAIIFQNQSTGHFSC